MKFTHVGMTVSNLERSIEYYKILGFTPSTKMQFDAEVIAARKNLYELEDGASAKAQFMEDPNGIRLEIFEFTPQVPAAKIPWNMPAIGHFCIHTTDLNALYEELVSKGMEIVLPPSKGNTQTFMFLRDPDGILVEVGQPYEK